MIVKQLLHIYYEHENMEGKKMSWDVAHRYHETMLRKGNIITYVEDCQLLGYTEFWRINAEQLGRLILKEEMCADTEDVTNGNICWVANIWINPKHRRGEVYKTMKKVFYERNSHCDYYGGCARRKRTGLIKMFKKSELKSSQFLKGIVGGNHGR